MKKVCKRCLLSETDAKDLKKAIDELKMTMSKEKKADDKLYHKRLDICLGCDELINGMCAKCGGRKICSMCEGKKECIFCENGQCEGCRGKGRK